MKSKMVIDGNTIELASCSKDGINCQDIRDDLNKNLQISRRFLDDKQYDKAFSMLLYAYKKTFNLKTSPCNHCAGSFRSLIYSAVETVSTELNYMTKGLFKQKRLIPYREMANQIMYEMRNIEARA